MHYSSPLAVFSITGLVASSYLVVRLVRFVVPARTSPHNWSEQTLQLLICTKHMRETTTAKLTQPTRPAQTTDGFRCLILEDDQSVADMLAQAVETAGGEPILPAPSSARLRCRRTMTSMSACSITSCPTARGALSILHCANEAC